MRDDKFVIEDSDLMQIKESTLNADGVIIINDFPISEKAEFAKKIKDSYDLILPKYPSISAEDKFIFLGAILNLLIFSFETNQTKAKDYFFKKSQFCYKGLNEKLSINPIAKASWCYAFGLTYVSSGYLINAIRCLEEAFLLAKQNKKTNSSLLEKIKFTLVESYLKFGLSLQSENNSLEIEKKYYNKAIKLIGSTSANSSSLDLYYFKAQAKAFLAYCEYRNQQLRETVILLIDAIHVDCIGISLEANASSKGCHLEHIKACIEKINEVLAQVENKENEQLSLIKPEINIGSNLLKNYHRKDFNKLVGVVDNLIKILNPQISEVGFFQHTSKSDKLLTKKPATLELNQHYDANKKSNP